MNCPFHLSILVSDLKEARKFYKDILGCIEGRSTNTWIDFDFFGNQLSLHLTTTMQKPLPLGEVDGNKVPIPHFGVIIPRVKFKLLADQLQKSEVDFLIEPKLRFEGKNGEQMTMFFLDPFGNALEIKSFTRDDEIFT